MKLSKLYSNKENFKEIVFNEGVNIIIGRIENPKNKDLNVHNLGKSLIVKIIDFVLLKSNRFIIANDGIFDGYSFFLEIQLNSGKYLTIKRSIGETKICFKEHVERNQNFVNENNWDYDDYTITSSKKNAKELLQQYLGFDVLKNNNYRNFITYFLRGQSDYDDPFKLSKFKGRDVTWKPVLFELLGYSGETLERKYIVDDEIEKIDAQIKLIQKINNVCVDDLDKYKTQLETLHVEIEENDAMYQKFNYFVAEQNLSRELVNGVEEQIAKLNLIRYDLQTDINNIKTSLEQMEIYDYSDLYEMYNEMKVLFNEQVKKSYDELLIFNNKITAERKVKLGELLEKKNSEILDVEENLEILNRQRSEMLKSLSENDEFQKFTQKQRELIKINDTIDMLKNKISAVKEIEKKENEKALLIKERTGLIQKIEKNISKGTEISKRIKNTFAKYAKRLISLRGILSIKPLQTGNIEFNYGVMNAQGEITNESEGYTYRKALCSCLDLTLITEYADKSFFRFVFHDGCVDGDDGRIAIKYLELVKELSTTKNLQCIITMIDSVVPLKPDGTKYNIADNEVILELSDNPDNSGLLFGFKF